MTDYLTVSDIQNFTPGVAYSSGTIPSDMQVSVYITQTEAEINATLAVLGFTTPVTATRAITIIKALIIPGVLWLITQAGLARAGLEPDESTRERAYREMWTNNKRLLEKEGAKILVDAGVTHPDGHELSHGPVLPAFPELYYSDHMTWLEATMIRDGINRSISSGSIPWLF